MNYLIKTMKTFLNPILKVKTFYIKTLCSFFLRRRDKIGERRKKDRERGGEKMRKIERVRERDKRRKRNNKDDNIHE